MKNSFQRGITRLRLLMVLYGAKAKIYDLCRPKRKEAKKK